MSSLVVELKILISEDVPMLTWKKAESDVGKIRCYLGVWKVASIKFYNGSQYWVTKMFLPGLGKISNNAHLNENDAKDKVEELINMWLVSAGLKDRMVQKNEDDLNPECERFEHHYVEMHSSMPYPKDCLGNGWFGCPDCVYHLVEGEQVNEG